MKIYQETIVDGMFSVPDLKLDWDTLLSDKYKLWAKYKYALLKFYYSPNHEGSCSDVAQEFNDKALSLNALIMNFGRAVQKAVGDFAVMRNNKMQYWIISMNGYNDEKNHFVWRLRPDLTDAIKKQLEKEAKLKEKFLQRFPVESLRTMPIEKYTNLNRNDSFCYWLESETYRLGSIWGGSSLKFGIYQFDKVPKENMPANHDEKYCWLSKYDCETSEEAYEIVRDKIATIAEKAAAGDLHGVDKVDFGDVVKWKIACLYSDNKVINMYTKELLQAAAKGFGYTGDLNSRPAMNEFITSQYDESRESFYDFYMRVGIHYFGKSEPEKTYWLVGYSFGSTESQLQRFLSDGVWESRHDDGNANDQKMIPLAQSISEGDILILKSTSTKGSKHDQPFMRIQAVGVVTSNITTYKIDSFTTCQCSVRYVNTEEKDFDGSVYGSYRKTIHKADGKLKDVIEYVNSLLSEEDMPMSETKQENNKKYQEYIDMLQQVHNLVLTGAPGTGKTYMAQAIAEEMGAVTRFVQFHPSYDYTDFVEGLRPIEKSDGQMGFERKDGAFKDFCREAIKNLIDSEKSVESLTKEMSWQEKLDRFVEDAIEEGTKFKTVNGSEFVISEMKSHSIVIHNEQNEKTTQVAVNADEILELLTNEVPLNIVRDIRNYFKRKFGTQPDSYAFVITKAVRAKKQKMPVVEANKIDRKPFVFIIDEINRGEASKIFGELFYAIDPGYRGKKEQLVQTQYQNLVPETDVFAKGFYVPENVYILATMNDIDRSVESMDFAMRRRFTWKEVTPADTEEMLDTLPCADEAKATMQRLNKAIADTDGLGTAYMIGPSYFLKLKDNGGDFNKLWKMNIEPLLKEYLRGFRKTPEILAKFNKAYFNTNESQTTDTPKLIDED